MKDGIQVGRFGVRYDVELGDDWDSFVGFKNEWALKELAEAVHHAHTRFIVTTASQSE